MRGLFSGGGPLARGGFFSRHRVLATALPPTVLGAAVVTAIALTLTPGSDDHTATRLTSSVTQCHDMVTISVAGRNDSPDPNSTAMLLDANGKPLPAALSSDYKSSWVDPVVNAPSAAVKDGSYAAVYVAYPADMNSYESAVDTGVSNAETVMRDIQASCPNTKFSVVGYSEGADVARRVAMDIGHQQAGADGKYDVVNPDNVLGVVILADNGRTAGQGPFPGAKDPYSHPDGFDTNYQNGQNAASGQGAMTDTGGDDFGALNGKVASFCSDGDLTCSAPQNISLLQLAANVGRQLNVDALQNQGLTPATGQDVAVVLGKIAFNAFSYIEAQPNWMQSDQTFLDVLLTVSDPTYKPGTATAASAVKDASKTEDSVSTEQLAPLAYLPKKFFNEIVGLIVTNQNTIPVLLNDPYGLTLAPGTGHHFDYWHDADAANGKPLSSAQYAAAWLTYLAQQAQDGKAVNPQAQPDPQALASALDAMQKNAVIPTPAPTAAPTPSASAGSSSGSSSGSAASTGATATATTQAPAATPSVTTTPDRPAPQPAVTDDQSGSDHGSGDTATSPQHAAPTTEVAAPAPVVDSTTANNGGAATATKSAEPTTTAPATTTATATAAN